MNIVLVIIKCAALVSCVNALEECQLISIHAAAVLAKFTSC